MNKSHIEREEKMDVTSVTSWPEGDPVADVPGDLVGADEAAKALGMILANLKSEDFSAA